MDTQQILGIMIDQRDRLNEAITVLQGPSKAGQHRHSPKPTDATRNIRSAAQREAQAEKMRAYWAARKLAEKPLVKKARK